jgi:hypothetical protein
VSLRKFTDAERPTEAQCYDCGFPYTHPAWIEAVVPDDVWERINPTYWQGAGLLCVNCIAVRCEEAGLRDVPVKLTAGPLIISEP